MAIDRLHREWSNRVRAEYTSAAITAQVLHWMIQCGLSDPLLTTALRIVRDELDHAQLSHDCLVALGGADVPVSLELAHLGMAPSPDGVLASLVDSIVRNFCLGETFAVPLFNAMREHTHHPAVQPMLVRVLQDEAIHRAFGWDVLDELLDRDGDGVRARVSERLPAWLGDFHRAYGNPPQGAPLSHGERDAGMIPADTYAAVHADTLANDIAPRFAKRGIMCPIPPAAPLPGAASEPPPPPG